MVAHSQSIHFSYKGTVEGPKAQTHYTLVKANSNLMLRLEKHARTVSLQLLRRAAPVDQSVFDLPLSQFNSQYGAEREIRCKKPSWKVFVLKHQLALELTANLWAVCRMENGKYRVMCNVCMEGQVQCTAFCHSV